MTRKRLLATTAATIIGTLALLMHMQMNQPTNSTAGTMSATAVRIQPFIYSGRPDPIWTLQSAKAKELLKLLSELPAFEKEEPQGGLGYRGLRLELVQTGGTTVGFRVHDGGVWLEDTAKSYEDKGRALERWLIATAPPDIAGELQEVLPSELRN